MTLGSANEMADSARVVIALVFVSFAVFMVWLGRRMGKS